MRRLIQSMKKDDRGTRFLPIMQAISVCALILGIAVPVFCQSGTGTITGTVTDPSGSVVPGAAVVVRDNETGIEHPLKTNDSGIYTAPFLQPGRYDVTVSREGFGPIKRESIIVQVGQTITIDFRLSVQATKEVLTVTATAPLLEPEKTDVSSVISQSVTENVPMANRRWNDFALLTPATTADGTSGLVSYRGISGLYNQNSVDGANNNQAFFSEARGRAIGAPFIYSSDSVKEYEVDTSNYSAEYGQAAGGIVNAVTKSGSNALHGDLFYLLRYPATNALDPFTKFSDFENHITPTQPVHQQQEFGGSVGGPIIKDKLFYFLTYDGFRKVFPVTYTSSQQAHFPLPCPVQATATQCSEANGFIESLLGSFPRTTKNDVFFGKLDYQLNAKNHLSGLFNLANWDSPNSYNTSYSINNNSVTANGTAVTHDRFLIGTVDSTLTPNAVNEVRFQWGKDFEVISSNYPAPSVTLSNITAYGQPNALPRPAFPDEHRIQISDSLSLVKGKHNLKFGFDANFVHDLIINLFNGSGIYSYSSTSTSNNYGAACAASNGSFEPFCNWVADIFALAGVSGTAGEHYSTFLQVYDPITKVGRGDFMDNLFDWYAQDTWKIRPNLTLNYGLRYDLQLLPPPAIPNTHTTLLSQLTSTMNIDHGEFAPRLGIAWQPYKNTVVRAGVGIFYALTQTSTYYALAYENGIFQTQYNCNPGTACAPAFPNVLFTPPGPPLASPFTGALTPSVCSACAAAANQTVIATHGLIPNFLPPRVYEGNLSVERQLPGNMTVSGTYLFSRGQRLPVFVDANVNPTSGVFTATYDVLNSAHAITQTFTEPFYTQRLSATGPILTGESVLNSWYNGLVLKWRKPMAHDLDLLADYTFSKSQDNGQVEGQFGTFYGTDYPVNPFNLKAENSLSDLNQTHHFGAAVVWTPSYFQGVSNRVERGFLNGWILATAVGAGSGQPVTADLVQSTYGGIAGSGIPLGIDGGPTGAVVNNSGSNTGGRAPWLGRNTFTGPGFFNMDARIGRNVPIRERTELQIRVDAFNLLNHQNVLAVNTSAYNFAAPGTSGCPAVTANFNGCFVPNSSFLQPTNTSGLLLGARQMQFSARLNF